MPIHDHGYARYTGVRRPPGRAWRVIARTGIRKMFSSKLFLLVLLFAWMQFFVRGVLFYLAANFPQVEGFIAPTPATFRDFFDSQAFFVFVIAIYTGAGAIANDRQANALPLYLARPLTRWEYVAGKLAVVMAFPAADHLGAGAAAAGAADDVHGQPGLRAPVRIPAAGGDVVRLPAVAGRGHHDPRAVVALDQRALRRDPVRRRGDLYRRDVRRPAGRHRQHRLVVDVVRGQPATGGRHDLPCGSRYDTPWGVSLLMVVAVVALSAWILARRVRGVEVVT